MSGEKISSDKVPEKFTEWLLAMGCPPEKVPCMEKIAEMCRGQYYMVWRSLMEHVKPKQTIRQKRLQVFTNDVQRSQTRNVFHKDDASVVVPEELLLWRQQAELKEQLADAEERVTVARSGLNQLMDKISNKLCERERRGRGVQAAQRRVWLLQRVAAELRERRQNLLETRAIADSLCFHDETTDVEGKLDKCVSAACTHPVQSSSIISTNSECDSEEQLVSLAQSSGSELWPQLAARRAALAARLSALRASRRPTDAARLSPQWVLSQTAALHCSLALDAIKTRAHIAQTQNRLTSAVTQLNNYLSGEECELLVLRCERARTQARTHVIRELLDELTTRRGAFAAAGDAGGDSTAIVKHIAALDKAIESKREELQRLVTSLARTERKTQSAREWGSAALAACRGDACAQHVQLLDGQLSLPQESVVTLRQFYSERSARRRHEPELSLPLDVSDHCSLTDPMGNTSPTFIDELNIYLKRFSLEKNRQLVLESGEKIWVAETVESSIDRLVGAWQSAGVPRVIICVSANLAQNLRALILEVEVAEQLLGVTRELDNSQKKDIAIDITGPKEQEEETADKIKKRLNEDLLSLHKSSRTLALGGENLRLWAENRLKEHMAAGRTVNGKTYKQYEAYYLESLGLNI